MECLKCVDMENFFYFYNDFFSVLQLIVYLMFTKPEKLLNKFLSKKKENIPKNDTKRHKKIGTVVITIKAILILLIFIILQHRSYHKKERKRTIIVKFNTLFFLILL